MPVQITQTKVILPRRRKDLLSRQRLLDLLFDLMDYKLVIVAAPAGYGKTSILIDFANQSDISVCWYSLDSLDLDPFRFFAHFIASIREKFPNFGKLSLSILESNLQNKLDIDSLVAAIVNETYEHIREHFIIVLDDYHLVNDQKEINYFISRFTQEVDENCHLILASRSLLTLPDMPLLVARSMVGGLSFEELTFLPDEIQSLIMQNYNLVLPRSVAEELAMATEGWITGLLLSTKTMRMGIPERMRVARVSRVGLYDYLAHQVLDQQTPEVRNFLLTTSLFEEFDIHLCEEIFNPNILWRNQFDYVIQNNLFVLPVGQDDKWFRYHHLFKDFLQARLEEENPLERIRILRRLVEIYAERREWERAYSTCQQLNDVKTTASLIQQAGSMMIRNGRLDLLTDWIDRLPPDTLEDEPNLKSLRAISETLAGHTEHGLEMLNQSIAMLRKMNATTDLALALVRRSTAYRHVGKYRESLEDAVEAQSLLGENISIQPFQADALRSAAISLHQMGQVKLAIENWNQAIGIYKAVGESQNVATILMELGVSFSASGQYRLALKHFEEALGYWREVNNKIRMANLLNNLGVLHHLIGNYEQAASTFEEALVYTRQNRYIRMEAYILASIGDLYSDLDASKAALDAYQKCHELAQGIEYHFLLLYTDLAMATRFRLTGDIDQAQEFLDAAKNRISEDSSAYERGLYELEAGRLLQAKGNRSLAINWLEDSVSDLESADQPVEAARARLFLADAYLQAGKILKALEELKITLDYSIKLDNQHLLVVCGIQVRNLLEVAQKPPYLSNQASDLLTKVDVFQASIPSLRKRLRPRAASIPFAPPKLVIRALGKTYVERNNAPITVPEWQNQRKVRELFFFLLTYPKGVTKEEIGLTFWPESSASQLKMQFKNTIYRLRHALGADVILFDEDHYWFNRELDYEYDVESFRLLVDAARSAEQIEQKMKNYTSALDLYKGVFLSEAEGVWIWSEREQLRKLAIQAALELARLLFQSHDYLAALEYCQVVLDEEPCLEEAHRLAMEIHAARGNRADISRQFERCKMILKNQVNTSPSSQTIALYEALIR